MPARKDSVALVVTCEHASNRVPTPYHTLFRRKGSVLASHRGWDPGAIDIAHAVARDAHTGVIAAPVSRLLVEVNRSPDHAQLFSEFTSGLDEAAQRRLVRLFYEPHRNAVRTAIRKALKTHERVIHLGVHTFVPVLKGVRRRADVGLLYDPSRLLETMACDLLREHLMHLAPGLRVRRNYPYRGWSDGLTTTLRTEFPPSRYLGIELEVNQRAAAGSPRQRADIQRAISNAVCWTLSDFGVPVTALRASRRGSTAPRPRRRSTAR